jgi:hypothetical protein
MLRSRASSAFTRVHSPSKTGVNALMDALWHGVSKLGATLTLRDGRFAASSG